MSLITNENCLHYKSELEDSVKEESKFLESDPDLKKMSHLLKKELIHTLKEEYSSCFDQSATVDFSSYVRFCKDHGLYPNRVSKAHLLQVFNVYAVPIKRSQQWIEESSLSPKRRSSPCRLKLPLEESTAHYVHDQQVAVVTFEGVSKSVILLSLTSKKTHIYDEDEANANIKDEVENDSRLKVTLALVLIKTVAESNERRERNQSPSHGRNGTEIKRVGGLIQSEKFLMPFKMEWP